MLEQLQRTGSDVARDVVGEEVVFDVERMEFCFRGSFYSIGVFQAKTVRSKIKICVKSEEFNKKITYKNSIGLLLLSNQKV